ncbi:ribonuclease BN (tRNA processing enzyme) [Sinobaca qinghaiensis]|uniref:Ribonuclease BN (tRNA processing enzyme) n=1 Tax=Sinobaca qinghaiensis TaxID=342944 RepID=A0A419V6S2_9BACL|nr:MBL fold metallo-hydrolase [Sinobaca qinghaiensis]RKD75660.1 ribonuclease BN (tRNA processing enzyme) [Sinobaca qinghaiensis]
MKITVVGFWHAYPEAGEAASGYLIEENGFSVLIDCGSGVVSNVQRYIKLEHIDAVVVSHYHNDHVSDIGAFHYFRLLQPYIQTAPAKPVRVFGHRDDRNGFSGLSYKNIVEAEAYDENTPLQIGPFVFQFYPVQHAVPCFAMRIQGNSGCLFYTADTSYFEKMAEWAEGADLLIAEASLYSGQDGSGPGHMNSVEAGRLAAHAEVKELLLTHLPHFGNHQQLVKEAASVYDGMIHLAASGWNKTI